MVSLCGTSSATNCIEALQRTFSRKDGNTVKRIIFFVMAFLMILNYACCEDEVVEMDLKVSKYLNDYNVKQLISTPENRAWTTVLLALDYGYINKDSVDPVKVFLARKSFILRDDFVLQILYAGDSDILIISYDTLNKTGEYMLMSIPGAKTMDDNIDIIKYAIAKEYSSNDFYENDVVDLYLAWEQIQGAASSGQ